MAIQTPEIIRRAWGDEVVAEAIPWIAQIAAEKGVPRDEFRQVLSRLDVLEHDVSDLKTDLRELRREMNERFDRMNERFDQMYQHFETLFDRQSRHIETRFDAMNERLDRMESRFDERLDQMNERMLVQTRWMVGTIALFGTLITVLLAVSQFAP